MRTAVVVGNPKAGSRTLRAALAAADALAALTDGDRLVVDLADVAPQLFDPGASAVASLLESVAASELLVVASPTYKATYTGLLKSFFDRYANDALAGAVAVGVMTGAAPVHALAVEVHLHPLLVELGASVPARGVFVTESQFDDLAGAVGPWATAALPRLRRALGRS